MNKIKSIIIFTFLVNATTAHTNDFSQIIKLAVQGHAKEQFQLGLMYRDGNGISKNREAAISWFQKAAKQRNIDAKVALKQMIDQPEVSSYSAEKNELDNGQDDNAAAILDESIVISNPNDDVIRLAKLGNAYAQYALSRLYFAGESVPQNSEVALQWLKKSADHGYIDAQLDLAMLYLMGDEVEQNNALAIQWYSKAADQGSLKAQTTLGYLYLIGKGVTKDTKKGQELLKKAAKRGDKTAQDILDHKITTNPLF